MYFYVNGSPPPVKLTAPQTESSDTLSTESPHETIQKSPESLNSLTAKAQDVLLAVRSMRIFDPFPDKLIIDGSKVSFIHKDAFGVKSIHSVLIENITYVEAHTSLISGTLVIIDSSNFRHPIELKIGSLRKEAAIRARKLIQGLIHAKALNIDFSNLNAFDLENNLEILGRVKGED